MKENGLKCIKFSRRSRGYSSFKGEVGIISFNLSTAPTVKFTTDALEDALKRLPKKHQLSSWRKRLQDIFTGIITKE
jgi:hypothetical protein